MTTPQGTASQHAAVYCRLSPRPDGSYEGVDVQEGWGRAYAGQHWPGLPVVVYKDKAISAFNGDDRPGYEAMRDAVRRGEVAHLWTVEQSRLERDEARWFALAAELVAGGVDVVHTNRDGIVRVGDEVSGIKAVLAAAESRKIARRVNDRLDANAAEGQPAGANVFGYRHRDDKGQFYLDDRGVKTLAVVEEEADAVRWAAAKVLDGWSLARVAANLDGRGLRGVHGGKLTAQAVRSFLLAPTVAGLRVHRGQVVGTGNWKPVLSEDVWRQVGAKLAGRRTVQRSDGGSYPVSAASRRGRTARKYLLSGVDGLARCGKCGSPMVGAVKQLGGGHTRPYLLCHPKYGGKACTGIMLPETEAHVLGLLFAELDRPEFLDQLGVDEHEHRRKGITDALAAVDGQRTELARLWAAGERSNDEWQAARDVLDDREQELRADLAAVPSPLVRKATVATLRTAWASMTLDEKREMLSIFISRVTINRARPGTRTFDAGRVKVTWRTL